MVGYTLYIISEKKFSKYHVMILMLANYVGPDIGWIIGLGNFTHTYAGYLVFAVFLAFFYSYFTRFSPDLKKRELVDNGHNKIPYMASYLLACAGGIMHVYLDGVMNHQGKFHLFPALGNLDEAIVTINDFFNFWYDPLVPANVVIALVTGMGLVFAFIPFVLYALKVGGSRFALKVGAFMAAFMALYYVVGNLTTLHAEGGAIVYVTLFWVIPFGLCALAMKMPPPRSPVEHRARLKQQFIPILLVFGIVLGSVFLAAGIALIALIDPIVALATGAWAPLAAHEGSLRSLAVLLGISFIAIGGVCTISFVQNMRKKDANVNIMVATGLVFTAGFVCLVLGGFSFTSGGAIVAIVFAIWPDAGAITTPEGLITVLFSLGFAFTALAGFNFVTGTGLLLERKQASKLVFAMSLAFMWTVVGLYVCCLLSQNEVRRRSTEG
jgi:hypothetical protein